MVTADYSGCQTGCLKRAKDIARGATTWSGIGRFDRTWRARRDCATVSQIKGKGREEEPKKCAIFARHKWDIYVRG